jgi:arginine repressor
MQALGKSERHRLIASLVSRKRVGTQFELLAALESAGCRVTQATVSRDLRELGLEKTHDSLGRPRYVLPEARRSDPRDALARVLAEFGRRVGAAQNIVVVHSTGPCVLQSSVSESACTTATSPRMSSSSSLARQRRTMPGEAP